MTERGKIIGMATGSVKLTLKDVEKIQEQINKLIEQQEERLETLQEIKSSAEFVRAPIEVTDKLKEIELEETENYEKYKAYIIEYSNLQKNLTKIANIMEKNESQLQSLIRDIQKRKEGSHGSNDKTKS